MKKNILTIAVILMAMLLASCGSTKNVAYFQNSDFIDGEQSSYLYDARILPKDQLTITVSTTNPDAAVPFNLTVPTPAAPTHRPCCRATWWITRDTFSSQ